MSKKTRYSEPVDKYTLPIRATYVMRDMTFYAIEEGDLNNLASASERFRRAQTTAWTLLVTGAGLLIEPVFMGVPINEMSWGVRFVCGFGVPLLWVLSLVHFSIARKERGMERDIKDRLRVHKSEEVIPLKFVMDSPQDSSD